MDDKALNDLALRLVELRQEKRYLDGEIQRVSQDLAEALGQGTKRDLGGVQVRVSVARIGVRISKAADVLPEFQSLQPDRRLLLQHFTATGEVPAGVEVTTTKPTVYANLPGDVASVTEAGTGNDDA